MNKPSKIDMSEVTRLTREGRLGEAMAILTGKPGGGTALKPDENAAQSSAAAGERYGRRANPTGLPGSTHGSTAGGGRLFEAMSSQFNGLSKKIRAGRRSSFTDSASAEPAMPDGARYTTHRYDGPGGQRDYKLYVPSTVTGDRERHPLVVMLHGCTQSPDDFARGTRMNELAEEFGLIVVYPAQSKAANIQKCWNWFETKDQQRGTGEPGLIAGITHELISSYAVDPKRVFVAGLSAGGAAAAIMGQRYPDLFAAVGVHSGLACGAARDMGSAFAAMRGGSPVLAGDRIVPTIVFHGDGDTTVAPVNGDRVLEQARAGTVSTPFETRGVSEGGVSYTRTVQREADGRERLESWRIHGAGHAWSGGSASGSYTLPGGPDASREMIRFFLSIPG